MDCWTNLCNHTNHHTGEAWRREEAAHNDSCPIEDYLNSEQRNGTESQSGVLSDVCTLKIVLCHRSVIKVAAAVPVLSSEAVLVTKNKPYTCPSHLYTCSLLPLLSFPPLPSLDPSHPSLLLPPTLHYSSLPPFTTPPSHPSLLLPPTLHYSSHYSSLPPFTTPLTTPPSHPSLLLSLLLPPTLHYSSLPPFTTPPSHPSLLLPPTLHYSSLPPFTTPPSHPSLLLPPTLHYSSLPPFTTPPSLPPSLPCFTHPRSKG